jgi:hypothetical protein
VNPPLPVDTPLVAVRTTELRTVMEPPPAAAMPTATFDTSQSSTVNVAPPTNRIPYCDDAPPLIVSPRSRTLSSAPAFTNIPLSEGAVMPA